MANVRNVQSNRESIDMSRPRRLLSTSKMLIFVEIAENSLEDGTSNIMATVIVYDNGSVEITNKRSFLVDRNDVFKIYFIGTKRVVWFYRRNRVKKSIRISSNFYRNKTSENSKFLSFHRLSRRDKHTLFTLERRCSKRRRVETLRPMNSVSTGYITA